MLGHGIISFWAQLGPEWLQTGKYIHIYITIHMCSGITIGRVLNGELLYTKILEVNLFAFAYRLFHEDFSSIIGDFCIGTHSFFSSFICILN